MLQLVKENLLLRAQNSRKHGDFRIPVIFIFLLPSLLLCFCSELLFVYSVAYLTRVWLSCVMCYTLTLVIFENSLVQFVICNSDEQNLTIVLPSCCQFLVNC